MWYTPTSAADIFMPEKRNNSWYRSPTGELRFVYELCDDGITVKVGVQSWEACSRFLGWVLYDDAWETCRQWAKDNGWVWRDE